MNIFLDCQGVNDLITEGKESEARNNLIKILDFHKKNNLSYTPLINNLIRQLGLYPYINKDTSDWQDRFIFESFKADIGGDEPITLHREQSSVLKQLLNGKSLAVSAPTSFGKSFIIDAFIALNNPNNVVIIVPTIALTDETRRRLQNKFSRQYKIITTPSVELADKNIFIFPQERAIHYIEEIKSIDILIVDEFYKASEAYDKERSPALINAIIKLGKISNQKYFLAPNISEINSNIFTKDMDFIKLDFNTVFLNKHNLFEEIKGSEQLKNEALIRILKNSNGKSLIYAGTYSDIDKVSNILIKNSHITNNKTLQDFETWLVVNYGKKWNLPNLIKRGCGVHNGNLHRSISQIQVNLFEKEDGIKNIVSTSSIIEGVNTSAANIILWRNKNGGSNLNDFTYKNIIGRAGRMFKHFIGEIYILETPPVPDENLLNLSIPDTILGNINEEDSKLELTKEQISKIILYKDQMTEILGDEVFKIIQNTKIFSSSDPRLILKIATDLATNSSEWNGLAFLNSDRTQNWDRLLHKVIKIQPSGWGGTYTKFVEFVKIISRNWIKPIPLLLNDLAKHNIKIDEFFKLEKNVTFKLASLVSDINILQMHILKNPTDITPFIAKISNAFLPPIVFQLEEYGLPRMISRKIQNENVMQFDFEDTDLHRKLDEFRVITEKGLIESVKSLDEFDKYIIKYFYEGI